MNQTLSLNEKELKNNWINGIDSIRFVLALIVLLSHFLSPLYYFLDSSTETRNFKELAQIPFNGMAAVIAFFVISGFVIHYTSNGFVKDLRRFLIKRYLRILIPLLCVFIIGRTFNNPEKGIVWSLICELIFYTLYPICVKIPKINWKKLFIISFILSYLFIIYYSKNDINSFLNQSNYEYNGHYWQSGIFTTWIVGLPCFILGIIIANNYKDNNLFKVKNIWVFRVIIFLISILIFAAKIYWFVSFIFTLNIFAILIYYWLSAEISYFKSCQSNSILEKLGSFSYSLYIFHPFALIFINKYLPTNSFSYLIILSTVIVMSYIFYLLIERPSHLLIKRI